MSVVTAVPATHAPRATDRLRVARIEGLTWKPGRRYRISDAGSVQRRIVGLHERTRRIVAESWADVPGFES